MRRLRYEIVTRDHFTDAEYSQLVREGRLEPYYPEGRPMYKLLPKSNRRHASGEGVKILAIPKEKQ